jgi:predicted lipoprotein with Yx(FWY)xxD motif
MKSVRIADICKAAAVAAVVTTLSATAHAEPKVLTDKAGMTVYTFDKDGAGKSVCYGDCAAAWPPVAADSMPTGSEVSAMSRDDGTRQAVYRGKPLYLFAGDKQAGDVNGDNVQNVWHAVPQSGAKKAAQPSPAAGSHGSTSTGYSYGY